MSQKKILNWIIIFILLVFLLSTWLVSVMYFVDKAPVDWQGTGENLSGSLSNTWNNLSGSVISGSNITGMVGK